MTTRAKSSRRPVQVRVYRTAGTGRVAAYGRAEPRASEVVAVVLLAGFAEHVTAPGDIDEVRRKLRERLGTPVGVQLVSRDTSPHVVDAVRRFLLNEIGVQKVRVSRARPKSPTV